MEASGTLFKFSSQRSFVVKILLSPGRHTVVTGDLQDPPRPPSTVGLRQMKYHLDLCNFSPGIVGTK